jgi:signal peptidase I
MRAWSAGSAAVLAAAAVIAVLRSSLLVVTVVGLSMAPGFVPGDRVLVRRRARGPLEVGRVVLLPEPGAPDQTGGRGRAGAAGIATLSERSWVIKRIAAMPGDAVPSAVRAAVGGARVVPPGMLVVLGDNIAQSADSRLWGFMRADEVLGVVVRSLPGSHPDGLASE